MSNIGLVKHFKYEHYEDFKLNSGSVVNFLVSFHADLVGFLVAKSSTVLPVPFFIRNA